MLSGDLPSVLSENSSYFAGIFGHSRTADEESDVYTDDAARAQSPLLGQDELTFGGDLETELADDEDDVDDDDELVDEEAEEEEDIDHSGMMGGCDCCPQCYCRLDSWCGLQSVRTRLFLIVVACIAISFILAVIGFVPLFVIEKTHDERLKNVTVYGGGSTMISQTVADLATTYGKEKKLSPTPIHVSDQEPDDSLMGIALLFNKTYQFALSDEIPSHKVRRSTSTLFVPMMSEALTLAYQFEGSQQSGVSLNISRDVLVGIYNGNITMWNDPAIVAINPSYPGVLPQQSIHPLHRTDVGSGASYIFVQALCSFSQTNPTQHWTSCSDSDLYHLWPVDNPPATSPSPCSLVDNNNNNNNNNSHGSNGTGASGDSQLCIDSDLGMAAAIAGTSGSIGYLTPASASTKAYASQLSTVMLENTAGVYTRCTPQSLGATAATTQLFASAPHSFTANVTDRSSCRACWAIVGFGYVGLTFGQEVNAIDTWAMQTTVLLRFLEWYFQNCHRDKHIQSILNERTQACLPSSDASEVLHQLRSVDPAGFDLTHAPTELGLLLWLALLIVATAVALILSLWRWPLWRKIRLIRNKEKERLEAFARLEEMEFAQQHEIRSQILHEVGITDTGDEVTLIHRIGSGGLATVYFAEWCGAAVAVKKLRQMPDMELQRQVFLEETTIMSKLRHPNVVQLLAACFQPDLMLVMEFCARGSLSQVIAAQSVELDDFRRLKMALDIARGLLYLHTRRPPIIHRDIKPLNILVTEDLVCKISDFGMAGREAEFSKHLDRLSDVLKQQNSPDCFDLEDQLRTVAGTMPYLPREVLVFGQWSLRSDIYSLAITFWELFSLQELYPGMKASEIVSRVVSSEFRPPLKATRSKAIRALLTTMWANYIEARPSIEEVYQNLLALVDIYEPDRTLDGP